MGYRFAMSDAISVRSVSLKWCLASVHIRNWNFVKKVPVILSDPQKAFEAKNGLNHFQVTTGTPQDTWLSCRIKVTDTEYLLSVPKP